MNSKYLKRIILEEIRNVLKEEEGDVRDRARSAFDRLEKETGDEVPTQRKPTPPSASQQPSQPQKQQPPTPAPQKPAPAPTQSNQPKPSTQPSANEVTGDNIGSRTNPANDPIYLRNIARQAPEVYKGKIAFYRFNNQLKQMQF